ncbi:DUF3168 domain-containing protein [Selenomonas ruminantium]|uniref:Uncharacterized protein n=1 Tax=Selenomonas ruminantium TaxID=971 RepID=A0A1I0V655_SELRU|nr:DUF3168 domain-containing protein [Selenomonas ruminantium]SFA71527.1 Protein of unknown function [Selenomonas ruminantium]
MSIKEKVYKALSGSKELTSLLVKDRRCRCVYPGISPNAGSYPILVYNVISDVPALVADGEEMERRVTVRIQILTKDGRYAPICTIVNKVMMGLGFMRKQTTELAEKDLFVLCLDYTIGIGVDE